ncbi:cation-dependent mannose-6-phosphate receptor-like isoform X2 [Pomacea canaliculata]|uniref:cation-dependent mannose-6-phosphate receptor-like isoform X2 n=1 Tax=Pomacea canaliculata TaxID=400727 RepID=UPI000D73C71A|nr:cation-dependent mannose-6-phosphate receptor-like isoform X2 [Pomacea canaliculata]
MEDQRAPAVTGELVKRFGSGQTRDVASVFVCVAASRMDNMRARLVVVLVVGVCSIGEVVWGQCTKTGPCTCQTSSGFVDLTPLASSSGNPKYKDQPDALGSGFMFSWNPCTPFDELTDCKQVSGCQVSSDLAQSFMLGTQDSATFENSSGTLQIKYSATQDSKTRSLVIDLICDQKVEDGNLVVQGELLPLTYSMQLTSSHCCIKPASKAEEGLSAGTILLIVFFSLAGVYVTVGFTLQICVRKATGFERIPNSTFWLPIVGFIKDGFKFTFTCGKASYSQI